MSLQEEPKKYAAFISYRHVMPDMVIAQQLQKMLERNMVRPNRHVPRNIRPVFLDTGEFSAQENLDEGILCALENSQCLYVICSPELPKSKYCLREIEYFKKIHGGRGDRIYTLLVAGTPAESFPDALIREERIVRDERGVETVQTREIEPLFANICAPTLRESLKKLKKTEYLRLAAAYYGCSYDALFKRRRRWQLKVAGACLAVVTAVLGAFGAYAYLRNLQYDAARAATFASYAEAQTQQGNELLAVTLCREGKDSAQRSGSARYMTALRSAVVQHDFRLRARPVALTMSVQSEDAQEPVFYLNADGSLALSMSNNLIQISDLKNGAILQQYPADSVAVDPQDLSVYVQVEPVRDENGRYQDTLFIRTLDGRLLNSMAFRESAVDTPKYKMISEHNVENLLGMTDRNELVAWFTKQGELLTAEEADALRRQQTQPQQDEDPPYYVSAASFMGKGMQVRNRDGETVLELETKKGVTAFSSDYALFGVVKDGVMTVYDTDSWTPVGSMTLPEGLLQQVYLLRGTGYALCVYHTRENFSQSVLVDWRVQGVLLEAEGYAYPDERNGRFYCMERGRIAQYAYRDMDVESACEAQALYGNRILSCQDYAVMMMDAGSGKMLWSDAKVWWEDAAYNRELTRILIPAENALRCRDETGRLLWEAETASACAALSSDGELAAYITAQGDAHVVNSADGSLRYAIPRAAFEQVGYPCGLCVSDQGVAVLGGGDAVFAAQGAQEVVTLGAYEDAVDAGKYLILSNRNAYVMDFAVWDKEKKAVVWQPQDNTGLWKWSQESGLLVRHREVSGNRALAELTVHRLSADGVEDVGALNLPQREVGGLWLDGDGRRLSVRAGNAALLFDLDTLEKKLEVTDCPVFYEDGRLWDWITFDGSCYSMPMPQEEELHALALDALSSGYGVRTLSQEEKNRYSFSE